VLIAGGGVGGLCLAQGLKAAGIEVTVLERDASVLARDQGYRLHISPEGEQALRFCVPERVQRLISATSNIRYGQGLIAYSESLQPKWAPQFEDPRGDQPDKIDSVDRVTFRRALLAGLDDVVRFGSRIESHRSAADGVVVELDDGSTVIGDVLIAADGSRSQVRAQYPDVAQPTDLGARTIFGRVPMNAAVQSALGEELANRFSYVLGSEGCHLGLMPMAFRTPPRQAAAEIWPEIEMDDRGDFYMCVLNMHPAALDVPDEELFSLDGGQLWDVVRRRTRGWHPRLREVIENAETDESFVLARRATTPVEPWPVGPVLPLGDAVHTMPPSGGVGANTALRDAAGLLVGLTAHAEGRRELSEVSRSYQQDMVGYASESLAMSLRIAQWSTPEPEPLSGAVSAGRR
jgi:2-polyprenyl-6-methoxyphenol hydroxylase-like FAD-dependent oxidoreductase